jgi:GntR family transcriptional regulator/MocR family aminotransferase
VLILNGSVQALSLLVHLLINPGDPVVVESPSFLGIRNAVTAAGGRIIPAPVDQDGMVIDKWNSKLAIVTPGHQYPTGCVMQKERRLALLDWAAAHNALILEDDFDSDFRRKGRPIEPLKILDTQGRVAYTGTFSRTLNRSLRVGYLVLPQDLKQPFLQAKQVFESYTTAPLEQMAIAIFMQHGHYERHLRKMARVYARKYERLIQLLDTHLPNAFTWTHSEVGTYLFGWWNHAPKKLDHFEARCKEQGVFWDNLRENFLENPRPAAIFGLAHLDDAKMETAVQIMAACYQSE